MPGILRTDSIDPLDALEAQIEELEKRIIGNVQISDNDCSIAESLINSNTTIQNAVSNYESLKTIFDRISILGKFLDPTYEDSLADNMAKTRMILESESELRLLLSQLTKLNEMNNSLSGEPFKNIPSLTEQLRKVSEAAVKTQEECNQIERDAKKLMENYSLVLTTMNRSLVLFDAVLSEIEENDKIKKPIDE
ncbi:hypothetical protein O3M35_006489 [Rhynocoris fuscipes]|uniref:Dynactin subunit 3 n=1 Tax=Rhynocoris fuscipes TaxID=488301 RepID=A0AAW1DG92_9HEMI